LGPEYELTLERALAPLASGDTGEIWVEIEAESTLVAWDARVMSEHEQVVVGVSVRMYDEEQRLLERAYGRAARTRNSMDADNAQTGDALWRVAIGGGFGWARTTRSQPCFTRAG
jgi:hypothetical protein